MLFDGRGVRYSKVEAGGKGERSRFLKDRVRRNSIKILFLLSDVGEFGDRTFAPVERVAVASENLGSDACDKGERSRFLTDSVWRSSTKLLSLLSEEEESGGSSSSPVARVAAASEKPSSGEEEDEERPLRLRSDSPWSCALETG